MEIMFSVLTMSTLAFLKIILNRIKDIHEAHSRCPKFFSDPTDSNKLIIPTECIF